MSRSDGIGRRTRLKIWRWQHRAGSSPAFGTIYLKLNFIKSVLKKNSSRVLFFYFIYEIQLPIYLLKILNGKFLFQIIINFQNISLIFSMPEPCEKFRFFPLKSFHQKFVDSLEE